MKKLLILLLVFGMASAANAALSLIAPTEIDEGDTATIQISSDSTADGDSGCYLDIYYASEGGFSLSNPRYTPIAPRPPIIIPYIYLSGDGYEIEVLFATTPGEVVTPGVWFEVDLTCLKADVDAFVEMYDSAAPYALIDSLTIHQIPEPMTIALLGLGGLFVLRRHK
jgi:hypothetical protein